MCKKNVLLDLQVISCLLLRIFRSFTIPNDYDIYMKKIFLALFFSFTYFQIDLF